MCSTTLFQQKPVPNVESVSATTTKAIPTKKPDSAAESSTKKLFLRDRIAKKKEIEDAELGTDENETNEKNELFVKDDNVGK